MPYAVAAKPSLAQRLRSLGSPYAFDQGPIDRLAAHLRRPLDLRWFRQHGQVAALEALGADVTRHAPSSEAPRVLVLALRSWTTHTAYEMTVAQALRMRGATVCVLTCGGGQPVCEVGRARRAWPRPCDRCGTYTSDLVRRSGLELRTLADHLPWGARSTDAPPPAPEPPPSGRDISAGWVTKSSDPVATADGRSLLADFAVSVAGVETAACAILDTFQPDVVFGLNGLFDAERTIMRVARERGIRTPTYEMAPVADALVFGQSVPAPDMDTDHIWDALRDRPLHPLEEERLDAYLAARARGEGAHERYFDGAVDADDELRRRLGIESGARVVTAFTNLAWDSALIGKDVGFASMFEWLATLTRIAAARQDVVAVIRVHPAEAKWGTSQPVVHELRERVGELPANVRIVESNEALSSYALMGLSDLVIAYTSTVGVEAAARGIPVAVAGDTHYRGRGFTLDLDGAPDLERQVAELPAMTGEQVGLARRYAHAFFFRFMLPFPLVRCAGNAVVSVPTGAAQVAPGADPYLDLLCDRILDGQELLVPDSLVTAPRG